MKSVKWGTVLRSACSLASVSVLLFGAMTAAATDVVVAPPDKGTLYLETGAYGQTAVPLGPTRGESRHHSEDPRQELGLPIDSPTFAVWYWIRLHPDGRGLVTVPPNAGFLGDHIGIKSTSGLCSEISGSESFRLALGGLLTGYQVYHTELNLEMKQHAVVKIVTQLGAGTPKTFILRSDGSYPGSELCSFTLPEHDVCRWKSDELWDSVTVTALAGRVSIEAGSGGGGATSFSKFRLTKLDKTLACPPEGSDVARRSLHRVTILPQRASPRLENSDLGACTPIPAALDWTGGKLQFFKADPGSDHGDDVQDHLAESACAPGAPRVDSVVEADSSATMLR